MQTEGPAPAPGLTEGLVLGMVCIQLVTELAMAMGVDDDGSGTPSRAHAILGEMSALAGITRLRIDQPDEVERRREILSRLQQYVRQAMPLMSRMARPFGFEGFDVSPRT